MVFQFGFTNAGPPRPQWGSGLLFNGILCVLFGLSILMAPELLAYFVAGILLFFGATLLTMWWKMRHGGQQERTNWMRWK